MTRSKFRRSPRVENLESRQLLSSVGPATAEGQDMLYWINLSRTNPPAAAQRIASKVTPDIQATLQHYGVDLNATEQAIAAAPKLPPLAWNDQLAQAAQAHSQDMASNQFQSHTGSDGTSSEQRMQQAGYNNSSSSAENAYAYGSSVDEAMLAFLIDWGVQGNGHRNNLLQPGVAAQDSYREVGIGLVRTSKSSSVGPMVVTQDLAARPNSPAQVVGVAFNDTKGNGFYDVGEGAGNVQIDAVNLKTGQVTSTQTTSAGGYQIPVPPGSYRIIASFNDQVIKTADIAVGSVNVEQDFILSSAWQGGSRQDSLASAQPPVNPPVVQSPVRPLPTPPQPVQPPTTQPQPNPIGVSPITWSWTSWKANVKQ